jgi:hypothetical protein
MCKLVELFCDVDDFCKVFIPQWRKQLLEDRTQKRQREGQMTTSEIMTIVVSFHMSHYRDFKNYYLGYVSLVYKNEFPDLLSFTRFLAVMPRVIFQTVVNKVNVSTASMMCLSMEMTRR